MTFFEEHFYLQRRTSPAVERMKYEHSSDCQASRGAMI